MLPKGYQPSKRTGIISGIILAIFAIYSLSLVSKRNRAFDREIRFTIGEITDIYIIASGREIEYTYSVNGVEYEDARGYAYNSEAPGGKYWVKYSVEYPEISEIYQNMPVDARIDTIPPDGFKGRYDYDQFLQWKRWVAQERKKLNHED
ncbi:MAG: hypothetical protein RLN88_08115 [Ekhidna sp.]|uniref:hypothetical protein n=1 Tax=Ekhidna sp. TaxID=2608089 RepID=UPI0032ECBB4F